MTQTLKIINFEQQENSTEEEKTKTISSIKIQFVISIIIIIAILSILAFNFELFLHYKTIFSITLFSVLLFTAYLLGKTAKNEKSYKLEILNNKELQNERTVEEMFYTSTIPLFQLSENGEFRLYNSSLSDLLNTPKLDKVNFFNNFGIEPKIKKHIIQKLRIKGSLENYRLWIKDIDENELYVNMNCQYVSCNKTSSVVIEGSLFDITLQYQKEQAIVKELESLRTKNIIAKNNSNEQSSKNYSANILTPAMGHELKTPISSMMGFLTLIEKNLYENKEELNNFTISARKSGEELLKIINRMLDSTIEKENFNTDKEKSVNNDNTENSLPILDRANTSEVENNLANVITNKSSNLSNQIDRDENNKPKLLLVEDNKLNQDVETKLLQKVGYNVTVIDNGEDAIELIKNNDFDLVLMDIELNGMDGLEAAKIIRALNSEKSNLPIIAATAKSSMKDRERCLAAGMNDYISKPINITFMKMTIDQWLNKNR